MTEIALPEGPFGCVYADPAWHFATYSGESAVPTQAADPYATMDLESLKRLPVQTVAAPDCALFMWFSGTHADQALDLGHAWGFTFKRSEVFIWIKAKEGVRPKIGMGYWTRKQTEQLWLFTRGSPKRLGKGVRQVIHCPRGAHSAKPEVQYEYIETLVGGPYLELFARTTRDNWTSWGNQVGERDGLFGAAA